MSTNIVYSGVTYTIPAYDDVEWGDAVSAFLIAIPAGMLTKTGGAWHLGGAGAADLDFGSAYGLVSLYLKSKTATLAQSGFIRMAKSDKIAWRNETSAADSVLHPNSSNKLTFGPSGSTIELADISTAQTLTNKTINAPDNTLTNIKDVNIAADALIAWSKINFSGDFGSTSVITTGGVKLGTTFHVTLQADPSENYDFFFPATDGLTGQALVKAAGGALEWVSVPGLVLPHKNVMIGSASDQPTNVDTSSVGDILADENDGLTIKADVITDAMVKAAAAIGLSKLAATTPSRAVATDASGFLVVSSVTDTELGYISGVTSAVQTQLGTKVAGPASATDNNIAVFDSTTGKLIKDGGAAISSLVPTSRTVNGQALSSNVTIDNNSLGAQTVFNGLEDASKFTVSYAPATRIFSLTYSVGAAYTVGGVRYTKTASTVTTTAHANTNGLWFLYFDAAGALAVSSTPWDLLITAPVALAYYNSSNAGGAAGALLYDERHPGVSGMDNAVHKNLHSTRGTQLVSGGVVSGMTFNTNGLANTSYAISSAVLADEDLIVAATEQLQGGVNTYRVMYLTGTTAAPVWNWVDPAEGGIYSNGTNVYWNELTGGSWQLTPLASNGFLNYWIVAITTLSAPQFVILMGQTTYSTLTDAQAASFSTEMANLGLLTGEAVIMYQMSYQRGVYGAPGNIRLRSAARIIESLTAVNNNNVISATGVTINTTSFSNTTSEMLSTADTTAQAAFNTIDNFPSAVKVLTNKDIDGGTASNTSRLTVPKNTKANLDALTRKEGTLVYASDLDALFADDGATLQQVGAGGAGAGRKNYIQNPSAAVSETTNWTATNMTVTRDTSTDIPRETTTGSAFKLLSTAGSSTATHISDSRLLDDADLSRKLAIETAIKITDSGKWTLDILAATFANKDILANHVRLPLSTDVAGVTTLPATTGVFKASVDTVAATPYLRYKLTAIDTGLTAYFSDILLTPDGSTVNSAVVGEWVSWTPGNLASGDSGTTTHYGPRYRRVGTSLEIMGGFQLGTGAGALIGFNLPLNLTASVSGSLYASVAKVGDHHTSGAKYGAVLCLNNVKQLYFGSSAVNSIDASLTGTALGTDILEYRATIPISEFSGGTVNVAGNDVEWASNSSTADGDDTTSFAYGPAGSSFPGTLTGPRQKRVKFLTPILPSDVIIIEISDATGNFFPLVGNSTTGIGPLTFQNTLTYGIGVSTSTSGADYVSISFGQYAYPSGSTYAAAGYAWGSVSGRYRVRKVSATSVAGFEMHKPGVSAGLVPAQGLDGRTDGVAVPAGKVGEIKEIGGVGTGTSIATNTYTDSNLGALTLGPGVWDIQLTVYFGLSSTTGIQTFSGFIGTASGNNTTGRDLLKNSAINRFSNSGVAIDNDYIVTTPVYRVNLSSSTSYYAKSYAFFTGGTVSSTAYMRATRIA